MSVVLLGECSCKLSKHTYKLTQNAKIVNSHTLGLLNHRWIICFEIVMGYNNDRVKFVLFLQRSVVAQVQKADQQGIDRQHGN